MVHGGCASIGCYAMTDAAIDELWLLVTAALNGGQERAEVHVFPFRMTDERVAAFDWHPWAAFWQDMKPAYDLFEESHVPPVISVCNKRYSVQGGRAAGSRPVLQSTCSPVSGSSASGPVVRAPTGLRGGHHLLVVFALPTRRDIRMTPDPRPTISAPDDDPTFGSKISMGKRPSAGPRRRRKRH